MVSTQATVDQVLLKNIVNKGKDVPGAMLPILHDIQDTVGYVPAEAVQMIADILNLSRAEVYGVLTYYPHFRQHPFARHVLKVCSAEACQAVGAEGLMAHAKASLGCDFHENSTDGLFSLEPVYCLGLCASGPALMVNDKDVHARVDNGKFDALLQELRGAK